MMNNPIAVVRKDLNLSPQQFAMFLKVSTTLVYAVEKGIVKNPKSIIQAMARKYLVADEEELRKQYFTWWEEKTEKERARVEKFLASK